MKNDGVEYASVNSIIVPCSRRRESNTHYYLQVGRSMFLIEADSINNDILQMAMKEAREIVKGNSEKILESNNINLV